MTMAPEKVDNSFTRRVGIFHPWEFSRKILEYEIQGVRCTWTPKDVVMNLKKMFQNSYFLTNMCLYGKVRNKQQIK